MIAQAAYKACIGRTRREETVLEFNMKLPLYFSALLTPTRNTVNNTLLLGSKDTESLLLFFPSLRHRAYNAQRTV